MAPQTMPLEAYKPQSDVQTSSKVTEHVQKGLHVCFIFVTFSDFVWLSGKMLVWGDVYIDQQFKGIACRIADYEGFICDLIEWEFGISVSEIQQTIRPVIIPDTICAEMKVPNQSLGLEMTRRYLNHLKQPVEVSINIFPEDRSVYSITLSRRQERPKD